MSPLTVLTGPNNGGKTSVLRAIKFALDSLRLAFGGGDVPQLSNWRNSPWAINGESVFNTMGLGDPLYLYSDRQKEGKRSVVLTLSRGENGLVTVIVGYQAANNRFLVSVKLDGQELNQMKDEVVLPVLRSIYALMPELILPVGTASPREDILNYSQLQERLGSGRSSEVIRNQIHWWNEDRDPVSYQRVTDMIASYYPSVRLRPPSRSRDDPPIVRLNYTDGSVEFDLAAAGGGLKTLVMLASFLELSRAKVLLLDEPESHMHPQFQREVARFLSDQASPDRQIIITTHAPDFIDAVPLESLLWIDRSTTAAKPIPNLSRALINLGTTSNTLALSSQDAEAVVFVEDRDDEHAYKEIFRKLGKMDLLARCQFAHLGGYGDTQYVNGAARAICRLAKRNVHVVAISDSDYTNLKPKVKCDAQSHALLVSLPCKELENLILLSSESIHKAACVAYERRAQHGGEERAVPSQAAIDAKIDEITADEKYKEIVLSQALMLFTPNPKCDSVDGFKKQFDISWKDPQYRRHTCSGKGVLRRVRDWLRQECDVSPSTKAIFNAYDVPQPIAELFGKIEKYLTDGTAP